jgi:putative Mg2+ transporter-C (MgtC) family protein
MEIFSNLGLTNYWNPHHIQINLIIILNLLGSGLLGMILGYERIFQGRAAGMRTYSLVCMASCGLTVFTGYASLWFGGDNAGRFDISDPTRVIQGIVTGVGFLGAGVIMKEGLSISGLSTAASIWLCSAIGVLVGVGFYGAAIALTFFAVSSMLLVSMFESMLPQKKVLHIQMLVLPNTLDEASLEHLLSGQGYHMSPYSLSIQRKEHHEDWHFIIHANPKTQVKLTELARLFDSQGQISQFTLTPVRN